MAVNSFALPAVDTDKANGKKSVLIGAQCLKFAFHKEDRDRDILKFIAAPRGEIDKVACALP